MIRAVLDTNILVSAAIKPNGTTGRIISRLRLNEFVLLYSADTLAELTDVLNRPHLRDKYHLTAHYLHIFLHLIRLRGEKIEPTQQVDSCRDPDDNQFLAVALDGNADFLVSNDSDLLVLSPFEGIPILTPTLFLEHLRQESQ